MIRFASPSTRLCIHVQTLASRPRILDQRSKLPLCIGYRYLTNKHNINADTRRCIEIRKLGRVSSPYAGSRARSTIAQHPLLGEDPPLYDRKPDWWARWAHALLILDLFIA